MNEALFDAADAASHDAWLQAVRAALKGGDPERLIQRTADDLTFPPVAPPVRDAVLIDVRAADVPWCISQKVWGADRSGANEQCLIDLNGGAAALDFVLGDHPLYPQRGPEADADPAFFADVLQGVMTDLIGLRVSGGLSSVATVRALHRHLVADPAAGAETAILGSLDPIAVAFAAERDMDSKSLQGKAIWAARSCHADFPRSRPLVSDGRIWHGLGATPALELALTLAGFVDGLRAAETVGMAPHDAVALYEFALAADANQLETIAKFRALRLLSAQVCRSIGADGDGPPVHSETAWRMMARLDADVNMVRATLATFSAAVGGADTITVLPHSLAAGIPNGFALRVARNTQTVLAEESNLARVADPARGAGSIENRTRALADYAWGIFQAIEDDGGLKGYIQCGRLYDALRDSRSDRQQAIAKRLDRLTGVSAFPAPGFGTPAILEGSAVAPSAVDLLETGAPIRDAQPFEALRAAADRRSDPATDIFLAGIGSTASQAARSTWARDVFEAGGLVVMHADGFVAAETLAEAFRSSGAKVLCLCGADDDYAAMVGGVLGALAGNDAKAILLAGRPDRIDGWQSWADGVVPIYEGTDLLSVLQDLHRRLTIV
ncbi:MAG: methylmalonyl-CoA mutase family protein [Pseudomonadota bacterium]